MVSGQPPSSTDRGAVDPDPSLRSGDRDRGRPRRQPLTTGAGGGATTMRPPLNSLVGVPPLPFLQLPNGQLTQLSRMPAVLTSCGCPIWMAEPFLELGRLLVAVDRPLMGGQLPALGPPCPLTSTAQLLLALLAADRRLVIVLRHSQPPRREYVREPRQRVALPVMLPRAPASSPAGRVGRGSPPSWPGARGRPGRRNRA